MIRRVQLSQGVVVLSDEGHGEPVVLLHGFTGSKDSWEELRAASSSEYRVVAVDLPGHGETVVEPEAFSFAVAGRLVLDALAAIGVGRFALVGYSMGGRLALGLALVAPQCLTALVLESASAGIADAAERLRRSADDEALALSLEQDGIEAFVESWEQLPLFASLTELPDARRSELHELRLRNHPAGLAASLRGMGAGAQPWLGERLGTLRLPTLLVAGERDAKYAGIARMLAGRIPGARLELVSGAGHVPHLERPEAFHRCVHRFLESVRPGRRVRAQGAIS